MSDRSKSNATSHTLASLDIDEDLDVNPLANLVKLVSNDGFEFIVPRKIAMISGTLRALLNSRGQWLENAGAMPTIELEPLNAPVLEKVIQYLFYKEQYENAVPPIPPFKLETDSIVSVLIAANYLQV